MNQWISVVALVAVLVLVGRGLPRGRWPLLIAATLGFIVLIVFVERSGLWPAGWRVR